MPAQTPEKFITALQSGGVLLTRNNDVIYFVPSEIFKSCGLVGAFGGNTFKGPGFLLVRQAAAFFIPQATLDNVDSNCQLPKEFGNDFLGISPLYFAPDTGASPAALLAFNTKGKIRKELRNTFARFPTLDGISQAIYLQKAENHVGKKVENLDEFELLDGVTRAMFFPRMPSVGVKATKAEEAKKIVFSYSANADKILVSMVKGGRPSDR